MTSLAQLMAARRMADREYVLEREAADARIARPAHNFAADGTLAVLMAALNVEVFRDVPVHRQNGLV